MGRRPTLGQRTKAVRYLPDTLRCFMWGHDCFHQQLRYADRLVVSFWIFVRQQLLVYSRYNGEAGIPGPVYKCLRIVAVESGNWSFAWTTDSRPVAHLRLIPNLINVLAF